MSVIPAQSYDERLHAAAGLLERPKYTPSGLAILLAIMALLIAALMLTHLVMAGPKAAPVATVAQASADFQLSGSAFPDADPARPITPGSEPVR